MTFKYTASPDESVKIVASGLSTYKLESFIPSTSLVNEEDFLEELTDKADYYQDYMYIDRHAVKSVMRALRDLLVETAKEGKGTVMLFDFFQLMPVCDGFTLDKDTSSVPPIDQLSTNHVNPRINVVLSDSLQRDFLEELELERVDVDGNPQPHIHFD